jgi:hypothetical protein
MSRRKFKTTPKQLQTLLEAHRFAFLTDAAREKIDALMEVVTHSNIDFEGDRQADIRWYVLPDVEKEAAGHRLSVCCSIYCLMVDGMGEMEAIRHLLERCQLSYKSSGIRKDRQTSVRALGLDFNFVGIRAIQLWLKKLDGVSQGRHQYLALVPIEVLDASQDAYMTALVEAKRYA